MKSAYEIAMERLEKSSGPSQKLTDDQRARIAEINAAYDAKIAQVRLQYETDLNTVASAEEMRQVQEKLTGEVAELEQRREQEIQHVWDVSKD
jgi:hypothetical protein